MGLPVVTDVLVSPSSAGAQICEGVSSDSDWEFVEPQPLSFSKKRSIVCAENQGEMSYEGMPEKEPPSTRRRMMLPRHSKFHIHRRMKGSSGKNGNCRNGELPGQKPRHEIGD